MKVAVITGISGQDGSYLAEFLLEKTIKSMDLFAANRETGTHKELLKQEDPTLDSISPQYETKSL